MFKLMGSAFGRLWSAVSTVNDVNTSEAGAVDVTGFVTDNTGGMGVQSFPYVQYQSYPQIQTTSYEPKAAVREAIILYSNGSPMGAVQVEVGGDNSVIRLLSLGTQQVISVNTAELYEFLQRLEAKVLEKKVESV